MKEENLSLNKTARKEEVLAYIFCKEYIFGDKECVVGDSAKAYCPDIYAKDFSVGAEVVICENAETFKAIQKRKTGNAFNKTKQQKEKKSIHEYKQQTPFINTEYKKYISEENEFFDNFEHSITEKLINQKNNHYKACKEMNLIVLSCFKEKVFVEDKEIFDYLQILMELHNNPYKSIYVVLGDRTLKIDNNYKRIILSDLRNNLIKEDIEK